MDGSKKGVCVPAHAVGEDCKGPFECATYQCAGYLEDGKCDFRPDDDPFVWTTTAASPALCTGIGHYGFDVL